VVDVRRARYDLPMRFFVALLLASVSVLGACPIAVAPTTLDALPCESDADCIDGYTCDGALCVALGDGDGDGDAAMETATEMEMETVMVMATGTAMGTATGTAMGTAMETAMETRA